MAIPTIPDGLVLVAAIKPSLRLLMIGTVWSTLLIPMLFLLFFLSTPQTRKTPIFILNTVSVVVGIVIGILNGKIYVTSILSPKTPFPAQTHQAYLTMILLLGIYMDCILIYRLAVIYPARSTARWMIAIIFAPVLVIILARVINFVMFMVAFGGILRDGDGNLVGVSVYQASFQKLWDHKPYTKIEWILQVFSNCLASVWFLVRIRSARKLHASSTGSNSHGTAKSGGASKLKKLFYLALSTFLFPTIFSIMQVCITFATSDFFLAAYIFVTNLYVTIIGVLMATIWAGKDHRESQSGRTTRNASGGTQMSSMGFHKPAAGVRVTTETTNDTGTTGTVWDIHPNNNSGGKFQESGHGRAHPYAMKEEYGV